MTSEQVWGEHAAEIYKCFVGRRPGLMPVYTKQIYFLNAPQVPCQRGCSIVL